MSHLYQKSCFWGHGLELLDPPEILVQLEQGRKTEFQMRPKSPKYVYDIAPVWGLVRLLEIEFCEGIEVMPYTGLSNTNKIPLTTMIGLNDLTYQ